MATQILRRSRRVRAAQPVPRGLLEYGLVLALTALLLVAAVALYAPAIARVL